MTLFSNRHFGSVEGSAIAVLLLLSLILGGPAEASTGVEAKFQRDLESLLGASVSSKHGEVSVRQRKDEAGRVRKQILTGKDFGEIQLDQNGDGSVDYWQVTRGSKVVTASHPYRGKFLRLVVSDRFAEGLQESTYLLDLGGRSYNLLKTKFTGKSVRFRAEDDEAFQAADSAPPSSISSETVPSLDNIEARATHFELGESAMIEHQTQVMGVDYNCESPDSVGGRLAALQREWWKILKVDLDQKADRLGALLTDSKVFDSSCKVPARKKELDRMVADLSKVMLSSSKGEPFPTDQTRGRYLRCLEQSGLGITAAQMEQSFLRSLNDPYRTKPAITCSFRPGKSGASVPAQMDPYYNQITVFMTAADEGDKKNPDGSPFSYANVLFHEFIHVAGMLDEDMTHAAQGCCGDGTDGRPVACAKLDRLVAREKRIVDLETHLARTSGELEPLAGTFEQKLGDSNLANSLYRAYLVDLDNYERGSPPALFANGLINDAEFSKCVAKSGELACRLDWTDHIRKHNDKFFHSACKNLVPKAKRKDCKEMAASEEFKNRLASNIANSMISKTGGSGSCGGSSSWNSPSAGKMNRAWASLSEFIFGPAARANGDDPCIVEVSPAPEPEPNPRPVVSNETRPTIPNEVPPLTRPGGIETGGMAPKRVTPGESDIGVIGGTDDRVDQSRPTEDRRPGRDVSPLPVTRVDSKNRKNFVENRYRRATDFAGSASRGLSAAREALLPTASATTRDRSARKSRLGPDDNFIAFRPDKIKEVRITPLDSPFAVRRGLASLSGSPTGSSGGSASSAKSGSDTGVASGMTTSQGASRPSVTDAAGRSTKTQVSKNKNTKITASSSAATTGLPGTSSMGGLSTGAKTVKADPLSGLFTLRYREIQDRLKRFDVVEALAARRIQILDAQGKSLGSKRPSEKFIFVGFEEPLRKSSE